MMHPDKRHHLPVDVKHLAEHYGLPMKEQRVCGLIYLLKLVKHSLSWPMVYHG